LVLLSVGGGLFLCCFERRPRVCCEVYIIYLFISIDVHVKLTSVISLP